MQKEIMPNKKYSIAANAVLLLWFFLDMIGIYFKNALKWTEGETRYIPDVYHTILHILILTALIATIVFIVKQRRKKSQ